MGASIEVEPCAKGYVASRVLIDPAGMVQGLSQLASLPDPPTEAIQTFLSSVQFEETDQPQSTNLSKLTNQKVRKRSADTIKKREITTVQCDLCPRTYVNRWNLARHVKTAHTVKRKRLVETDVFECEECDFMCASQAALETHIDSHITSTEATKSPRYKCAFCNKELASIYNHYVSKHLIECPEQMMFDNGNVLVHSSINPDEGKAPWFLKAKEKLNRYTNVTCRLCEYEPCFDNREKLENHYVMNHMIDPGMLDHLKRVFRAEKGAHLIDLPASQTPKRKQSVIVTLDSKQKVSRTEENGHSSNLMHQFDDQANKKPEPIGNFNESDQVYPTEPHLNKNKNDKHAPKTDKAKGVKYKCCLCNKDLVSIYKHYGNAHNIEYPEQMLFENGNVLVLTDIYTNGGQAPWFKSQKEKAEMKYTSSTCRLCDADFYGTGITLDRHYMIEHKIEQDALKSLNNLRCLFRADKGAHLSDKPTSRPTRRVSSYQTTSRPVNSESKSGSKYERILNANEVEQDIFGLIIYQCVECGVATTTCDASIEHAQLHHFTGYKAIPQTCGVCKFSFEAQCFADHSSNHLNNNEYRIVKFDPSKLLDKWSNFFQGLSANHAERIKSSSTYQHTRRVKMNSNMASGIALYQCGKCDLYVRPKDVEAHCYNYNCIENQAPGHFCPDCEKYFYTSVALTEHEKDHKFYGAEFFKTVTFNCKEDEPINRALQSLKNNLNSFKEASQREALVSEETQQKKKGGIKILQDIVVRKFCDQCKQSFFYSEFDAHVASHRNNQNADVASSQREVNERVQEEGSQEQNFGDSNDIRNHNNGEMLQTKVTEAAANEEGTVELWNSENDSCNSQMPPASTFDVQVEVHVQKEEVEEEMHQVADDMGKTNSETEVPYIFDEFSEEMENDIKRDIQHLGLELFGMAYIPDKNLEDKDLLELKSALTELRETSDDDRQGGDNNKADSLSQDSTSQNVIQNNGKQNSNNTNDIIVIEDDSDDEIEFQEVTNNSRPSSRDILTRMLSK